jgi:hypothetical protein
MKNLKTIIVNDVFYSSESFVVRCCYNYIYIPIFNIFSSTVKRTIKSNVWESVRTKLIQRHFSNNNLDFNVLQQYKDNL